MNPSLNQSMNPFVVSRTIAVHQQPLSFGEVRVSFSSMLTHPINQSIVYFQLRADGHNQDVIIEHPTGLSVVCLRPCSWSI